jgi:sugar phosphate isomerase/epimerase
MLREHCKTAEDFAKSAARLRAIGYKIVQVGGLGPIPPAEIRRICDGEGLAICGTHESAKGLVGNPKAIAERLGILGCKHTAYPYPHLPIDSTDDIKALVDVLLATSEVLSAGGVTLAYHTHGRDFRKIGGKTVLDQILELAPADRLAVEIDTYWVQAGGCDPASLCRRLRGRLPMLHLKDYAVSHEEQPTTAALGDGNLDFAAIVPAALDSGAKWLIVEQDGGYDDPFTAAQRSYRYLERNIFGKSG